MQPEPRSNSADLLAVIARLRRLEPRNALVLLVCDEAERNITQRNQCNIPVQPASNAADGCPVCAARKREATERVRRHRAKVKQQGAIAG